LAHENDDQMVVFDFETSAKMSTYLVAYVVGDFDYLEDVSDLGVVVRVYTPVGKSHLGRFSLDLTLKALKFFTNYFGIKYPLPKLDLIALNDIEFGINVKSKKPIF
jgi:puromycin-sensitive aminopeptidase